MKFTYFLIIQLVFILSLISSLPTGIPQDAYNNHCVHCVVNGFDFCNIPINPSSFMNENVNIFTKSDENGKCCGSLFDDGEYCIDGFEHCTSGLSKGVKYFNCERDQYWRSEGCG